jgi:hypothetical protein
MESNVTSTTEAEMLRAEQAKQIEQEIIQEQSNKTPSLEEIESIGKTMLAQHLGLIEAHKETVTLTGFVKALRLAIVHDVAPELQEKVSLINKQQFLAGIIAQTLDTKFNLRMAQLGAQMKKDEEEQQAQSAEGETNGNN